MHSYMSLARLVQGLHRVLIDRLLGLISAILTIGHIETAHSWRCGAQLQWVDVLGSSWVVVMALELSFKPHL